MSLAPSPPASAPSSPGLAERVLESSVAAMELACIHLGARLGLYESLAGLGAATAGELAAASGTDERYVREWLEQQAVAGVLIALDPAAPAGRRRFALPAGHAESLLDPESLEYAVGLARLTVGVLGPIDALADAFRSGEGVPYAHYGDHTREGIAAMNRPMFASQLGREWLPAVPDVHARLSAGGARVADVACGLGWSSIAIARAYPGARVDGFDLDAPSVERARRNAREAGLDGRVRFAVADAAAGAADGTYDLVTIFEAVHDMARPVEALGAARRMLRPRGCVVVADERVGESFTAPGEDIERLNYGFSVLHCLAVGREEGPSAATGTVIRPHTMEGYARDAGFGRVEVLPIDHDFWRFWRLEP